jgi:hypothetical protein
VFDRNVAERRLLARPGVTLEVSTMPRTATPRDAALPTEIVPRLVPISQMGRRQRAAAHSASFAVSCAASLVIRNADSDSL